MFLIPILLLVAEFVWQTVIKYPPTLEQLSIGVANPSELLLTRIASLILILFMSFLLSKRMRGKARGCFWIILLTSPTITLLWMANPLDCLKLFLIGLVFFLLSKLRKTYLVITGVCISLILLLNLVLFNQKPAILNLISPNTTQTEVINRVMIEGDFTTRIKTPNLIRRLAYNKYFVTLKNFSDESLNFFDLETLFFQEVHPLGQKAFVMFFWPEVYLLVIGVWYLGGKKQENQKEILSLLVLSFVYFLTTNTSTELRLALTLWPITFIIAGAIDSSLKSKSKILKASIIIFVFVSAYGYITNYYDRYTRPLYYLDNRPPAYEFIFNSLKSLDLTRYQQVVVPNTLYSTKEYCKYYLKNCGDVVYKDFNLSKELPDPNTLYIGFTGNFLGPKAENDFPSNYADIIATASLTILRKTHINDNIANQYGQDLMIVRYEKK